MKSNGNQIKIRAAIVGLGNYARVIANKLIESNLFEITWCMHYQQEKANEFADSCGGKGCDSFGLVIEDSSLDAVFVLTPNDSHFELVQKALQAGKHVFVEKPMTNTVAEAEALSGLLDGEKVFMVGHNYRRKNGIRVIKQLIEDDKIGNPVHFEMIVSHGGAFNFNQSAWRNDPRKCIGGPLSMLGTHSFEVLQYLLGEPASIYSINQCTQGLSECEDSSVSLLTMKNGATALLQHHYVVPSLNYVRLEGTEGTVTYEIDSNQVMFRTGRDANCVPAPTQQYELSPLDDRLEQVIEFAQAIMGEAQVETDYSIAFPVVSFVEKAMESTHMKKVVSF